MLHRRQFKISFLMHSKISQDLQFKPKLKCICLCIWFCKENTVDSDLVRVNSVIIRAPVVTGRDSKLCAVRFLCFFICFFCVCAHVCVGGRRGKRKHFVLFCFLKNRGTSSQNLPRVVLEQLVIKMHIRHAS